MEQDWKIGRMNQGSERDFIPGFCSLYANVWYEILLRDDSAVGKVKQKSCAGHGGSHL